MKEQVHKITLLDNGLYIKHKLNTLSLWNGTVMIVSSKEGNMDGVKLLKGAIAIFEEKLKLIL